MTKGEVRDRAIGTCVQDRMTAARYLCLESRARSVVLDVEDDMQVILTVGHVYLVECGESVDAPNESVIGVDDVDSKGTDLRMREKPVTQKSSEFRHRIGSPENAFGSSHWCVDRRIRGMKAEKPTTPGKHGLKCRHVVRRRADVARVRNHCIDIGDPVNIGEIIMHGDDSAVMCIEKS